MNTITLEAITEIRALNETAPQRKHIATGDIRRLSARLFRKIENRQIDNVFVLCEELFSSIIEWTKDEDFWVRRASAVVLIPAIFHNDYNGISPFMISDALEKYDAETRNTLLKL